MKPAHFRKLIGMLGTGLLLVACGSNPAAEDARGRECLTRNDLGCAIEAFSAAVSEAPREPRYRYNLGLALAKMGALEQARHELEIAVELAPGDFRARGLLERVHRAIAIRAENRILLD